MVAGQERDAEVSLPLRDLSADDEARRAFDDGVARVDDADLRSAPSKERNLELQLFRKPFVVVVQEGDELAAGRADSGVSSRRRSAADLLPQRAKPGIGEARQHFGGLVLRGVVDDDHLEIAERLPERAPNGGPHQTRAIAGGNDDGDRGIRHSASRSGRRILGTDARGRSSVPAAAAADARPIRARLLESPSRARA